MRLKAVFFLNPESEPIHIESLALFIIGDPKCWIYSLHFIRSRSGVAEDHFDRAREFFPGIPLRIKLFLSRCSQFIELRPPVILRCSPFGGNQPPSFEPVEGGIE